MLGLRFRLRLGHRLGNSLCRRIVGRRILIRVILTLRILILCVLALCILALCVLHRRVLFGRGLRIVGLWLRRRFGLSVLLRAHRLAANYVNLRVIILWRSLLGVLLTEPALTPRYRPYILDGLQFLRYALVFGWIYAYAVFLFGLRILLRQRLYIRCTGCASSTPG